MGGIFTFKSTIQPNTPKLGKLTPFTATSGTWYTVANVASGKGKLTRALVGCNSSIATNNELSIRVTVDNKTPEIITPSSLMRYLGKYATSIFDATSSIDYPCDVCFKTSLLVEIRHTHGSDLEIEGFASYSLVA